MANKYERYTDGVLVESIPYTEEELAKETLAKVMADRKAEHGTVEEQIERIVKSGIQVERNRRADIDTRHPKP